MQSIFAIFYAGFSTGALEKSTSMRFRGLPAHGNAIMGRLAR